jgi:hypothetical protein
VSYEKSALTALFSGLSKDCAGQPGKRGLRAPVRRSPEWGSFGVTNQARAMDVPGPPMVANTTHRYPDYLPLSAKYKLMGSTGNASLLREEFMLDVKSLLLTLLSSSWGVVTVVLIAVVIYRGILSTKEDDQIFIEASEQHYYDEQQAIIARMSRLKGPIIALSVVSGVLFLTTLGVWIYQGYSSF